MKIYAQHDSERQAPLTDGLWLNKECIKPPLASLQTHSIPELVTMQIRFISAICKACHYHTQER